MAGHRPSQAMPIPSSSSSTHRLLSLLNPTNSKTSSSNPASELDELDESDVLWSDLSSSSSSSSNSVHIDNNLPRPFVHHHHHSRFGLSSLLLDSETRPMMPIPTPSRPLQSGPHHQSAPMPVRVWPKRRQWAEEEVVEEQEEEEEEVGTVPPHVMAARRARATTSFSVLEGAGRTLKGRDLRRVRNAVWRETGFLDL